MQNNGAWVGQGYNIREVNCPVSSCVSLEIQITALLTHYLLTVVSRRESEKSLRWPNLSLNALMRASSGIHQGITHP